MVPQNIYVDANIALKVPLDIYAEGMAELRSGQKYHFRFFEYYNQRIATRNSKLRGNEGTIGGERPKGGV